MTTHPRLSEAEAGFLREERRRGQSGGRIKDFEAAFRTFREWLEGRDPDLLEITPQMAGDYRIAIAEMPASSQTRPQYRELGFQARIALARETHEKRLLTATTIGGKYITPLRLLFQWAGKTGKIALNPFEAIQPPKSSRSKKAERLSFTGEQLKNFFAQPLFLGAAGLRGKLLYTPGPILVDDWRYWIPLIALFSGARLNEICGLNLDDFADDVGITYFHVRPDGDDKRVKTAAGIRRVPLHPELVALGLVRRVHRLRDEGESRLFPDLKPGPRGYLSEAPSKFYADFIDRSVGDDARLVFHSFRHTFITALRAARVDRMLRMAIVGHDPGETHEDYGEQDISSLGAEVAKVSYKGLDLSAITRAG